MTTKVTSYAKQYTKEMAKVFQKRTRRVAEVIAQELRKNLSSPGPKPSKPSEFPKMQSGAMVRGVRTVVTGRSPYTVRVTNTAPHAQAQEVGAKGGTVIVPTRGKALKFKTWGPFGSGKTVFAKAVTKGKLAARSPIKRTLQAMRGKIKKIYTRGVAELKGNSKSGNKAIIRLS